MATLLLFDTSTPEATVAVSRGETILAEARRAVTTHSEGMMSLIDEALGEAKIKPADLDAICVGRGPGSYTGVRIGMATAKGLCLAAGKPLITVSSLLGPARATRAKMGPGIRIATVLDARRGEVFVALFDGDLSAPVWELVSQPEVIHQHLPSGPLVLAGDGAKRYREVLLERLPEASLAPDGCHELSAASLLPAALRAFEAGQTASLETAEPVYLRSPDIRPNAPSAVAGSGSKDAPAGPTAEQAMAEQVPGLDIERLRQSGLRLDRHGRWWHEERLVEHDRLSDALHRWIDRLADGRFIVRLDSERFAYIEVEDTPYLVRTLWLDRAEGRPQLIVSLSDGSQEALQPQTVWEGQGEALYCLVKEGRFSARLTQQAQLLLAEYIEQRGEVFELVLGDERFSIGVGPA